MPSPNLNNPKQKDGQPQYIRQPSHGTARNNTTQQQTEADTDPTDMLVTGWRKYLSIFAAGICLMLAALGAVLPGLPTTPFLLLASYLLIRSSPRLHQKLRNNRLFGPLLRDWETKRAVKRSVKIWSLVVVAVFLSLSLYLSVFPWYLKAIVLTAATIGIYVICRLPEIKAE